MAPYQEEETFSGDPPRCGDINTPEKSSQDAHKGKRDDPFLYYSNDEIRMKTLMLEGVSEAGQGGGKESRRERKTRISFELHHSLIMDDELEEIPCDDISNDIDYNFGGNSTQADLLRELLQS